VLYESGIENVVLTIQKNIRFHNSRGLELKIEDFNAFKHDQFYRRLPAVDRQIGNLSFCNIKSAAIPTPDGVRGEIYF
jgi:hypothetical protein